MAGYPDAEDLVDASDVTELTGASEDKRDEYYALAIAGVEAFTGQSFTEEEDATVVLDGRGGGEIYLPRRLVEITAIEVRGTSIDLTDVEIRDDGARLALAPLSTSYAVQAMRDEVWHDTRTFRVGAGTVRVTGTWGWSEPPSQVVTALRWDMEDQARADQSALAGTIAAYRRLGMTEIVQGNLRATIGRETPLLSPRAQALLQRFVWRGEGGYLV